MSPEEKKYKNGTHPKSLANLKKGKMKKGVWIGREAYEKKKLHKCRTTHPVSKRLIRRKGSVAVERLLKDQGFDVGSGSNMELFVARTMEVAIKEGCPNAMLAFAIMLTSGKTGKNKNALPFSAPMKNPTKEELNSGRIREIVMKSANGRAARDDK